MAMQIVMKGDFEPNEETWEKIADTHGNGIKSFTVLANGSVINASDEVQVLFGPVVGEVTETSAIVLIETQCQSGECINLECKLFDLSNDDPEPVQVIEKEITNRRPQAFKFEDLEPNTNYQCWFSTSPSPSLATFKTKKDDMDRFRLIALSCDKPSRLLLGQLNPWKNVHKTLKKGHVDMILHLGDQIYPDGEDIPHAAKIFAEIYDEMDEDKQVDMMSRGRELWRQKYRKHFNLPYKKEASAMVSNLTIWSDNDVANDFTTMKLEDGTQAYHPKFLQCGMEVYREYQRRLWDQDCTADVPEGEEVQEWHSHIYGNGKVGVFIFDLRGNRITPGGEQMSENSLLSEAQWQAFEDFMANPDLRAIILCSETPFIGDEPMVCKEKVECEPKMDFLRDHWPFNEDEVIKLVEICFSWKEQGDGMRDLIMVSGDIHCGVTSILTDQESGLQINHYVTSPITNHVCKFFPPREGSLNDRFQFSHLPLGETFRNYLDVDIHFEEDSTEIQAKLVPISTDIFKNTKFVH